MKKLLKTAVVICLLMLISIIIFPQKTEAALIKGYYKKNGIYVAPYYRSSPNALKYDNYSYKNGSSLYNKSYFSPTRNYSSSWYTPSYITQPDYYIGKNYYNSYSSRSWLNYLDW